MAYVVLMPEDNDTTQCVHLQAFQRSAAGGVVARYTPELVEKIIDDCVEPDMVIVNWNRSYKLFHVLRQQFNLAVAKQTPIILISPFTDNKRTERTLVNELGANVIGHVKKENETVDVLEKIISRISRPSALEYTRQSGQEVINGIVTKRDFV